MLPAAKYEAKELFQRLTRPNWRDYEEAIELYKRSIETYPTASAYVLLGLQLSESYDEAIEECLEAIRR